MKRFEISQMPVIDRGVVKGYISEKSIIDALLDAKDALSLDSILEPAPPIVPGSTVRSAIITLLNYFSLVLVSEKGKLKGIITRADLIRNLDDLR